MNTDSTFSQERYDRLRNGMRSWLYSLVRRRTSGTVTADDAHTYLDRNGIRKGHIRTRLSFINSVLRESNFDYAGTIPSMRPAARRRQINEWTVR